MPTRFDSATTIINDAALELGIGQQGSSAPAGEDPWASKDNNILKLIGYLKNGGRRLVRLREWAILTKDYSFVTNAGIDAYNVPDDFRSVSTRTGWDRTNRFPLGGPLDGIEWQYLKGILAGNPLILYFRPRGNQLLLAGGANVPGNHTLAFEYSSRYWAGPVGATLPAGNTKDFPTQKDDVVFLDSTMMSRMLMHDFASKNGMGDIHFGELTVATEQAMNDDAQMPVLSLARDKRSNLLSSRNLPPTGWGT